jgi:peptide deformylase
MNLKLVVYPDERLRQKATPLPDMPQDSFDHMISEMYETMYDHAGQGLAAPQIGFPHSVFVVNSGGRTLTVIDPELLEYGKRTFVAEEGCLSIPGVFAKVERPGKIKLRYFPSHDAWKRGKATVQQYEGPMGRVIQHEYDHLRGRLFIDLLNADELEKVKSKLAVIAGVPGDGAPSGLPLPTRYDVLEKLTKLSPAEERDAIRFRSALIRTDFGKYATEAARKSGADIDRDDCHFAGPKSYDSGDKQYTSFILTGNGRTVYLRQSAGAPTEMTLIFAEIKAGEDMPKDALHVRVPIPGWTEPLNVYRCGLVGRPFLFLNGDDLDQLTALLSKEVFNE